MMDRPASRQMGMELDDDAISLTSTQSEKYTSDQEFLVEAILAERKQQDSKMYYLIRWENYPEEKATWEPKKNIQDPDILKAWKERKSKEANGTAEPYDLVRYEALLKEVAKRKKYRHRLRKVKRRRAGIPVSPDASDSESSEAREEEAHQTDAPGIKNKSKAKPSPQKIKKKTQRVLERPASRESPSKPKPISKKADHESDSSSGLTNDRYVGDKKKASKKALQALREKRAQRGSISEERQPSPGKNAPMASMARVEKSSSNSAANIAPIKASLQRDRSSSPEIPLSTTHPLSGVSSTTPTVASRQPSPTKAATRIVSTTSARGRPTLQNAGSSSSAAGRGQGSKRGGSVVGIKNVFSGGTTRKAKPTFLEQSADPSKKTKHLSNMHQQYSLQMQSRNLADKAPDLNAIGGLYDPANPGKLPAIRPSDLRRTASNNLQGQPDPQPLSLETDSFVEAFDNRRDSIPMAISPVQVEQAATTTDSVPPWHNPDPHSRACWFWRIGSYCSRGNECAYLHTDDMSIPTASEPLQRGQQYAYSTNWKTRPCLYFIAGKCARGDGCSFLHSEEPNEAKRDAPAQISGPPAEMAPTATVPAANANLPSNLNRPPDGADEDMTLFLPSDPVRSVVPRRAVSFADEPTSMLAEPETYTPNVPCSSVTSRGDELNPMVRQANMPPSISVKKSVSFTEKDPKPPVQQHESMAFHEPAPATRKEKRFNKTCIFWVKDDCSHGDRCWYNHFYGNVPPPYSSEKEQYSSLSVENSSNALPVSSRYDQSSTVNRPHLQTPTDFSAPVPDLPLDTSDHMQTDTPKSSALSATAVPAPKVPWAKMSMENYLQKKVFKTLGLRVKEVFFGREGSQPVVLDFGDLEQTLQHSWRQTFSALANIQFDQMCGARDFEAQKSSIVSQALWEGNLVCDPSDQSALSVLDRVSRELRMYSGGLISTLSDFTILIYPPGEEWNFMDSSTRFEADTSLRYLIFKTNLQINGNLTESKWESSLAYRKALTKTIHGLSFAGLVPKRVTDKPYHFFLLFPPSANQTAEFIVSWLKVAWPQQFCKIYTSQTEGSWDHFIRDHFINDPPIEYGVVLIHRSAILQISELPSIKNLLSKQDIVNFWYIDDSSALYPAIPPPLTSNLGQITASKMLPAFKNAIFLTPSLFVVHPDKANQVMEWFRRKLKTSTPGNYKLVCSYKIRDYVLDLALDKAAERDEFQERHRDLPTKDAMEESAGLSWKTCESRFHCHRYLTELLSNDVSDGYSSFYDSDCPNEDISPIIYADASIDPDDEQALVTWFAYWSLTQLDKFRRFTVIGTSPTNPERAKRTKEVPVEDIPGVSPTPVRRQSLIKPFSPGKVKATDKDNSPSNNGKLKAAAVAAKLNASAPHSNTLPRKSVEKNADSVQSQRQPPASTATLRSPTVQSTLQEAPRTPTVSSISGDNSGRVVGALGSHMIPRVEETPRGITVKGLAATGSESSAAPRMNTLSTEAQVEELIATTRAGEETRLPRLVTSDVAHSVAMLTATSAPGPVADDYSPVIEQQSYSPQFNGSKDSRPQSSDSASSAALSGIIDYGNGNRFVPKSIRPSGTIRPERPVRPSFIPIEDQVAYKNRRVVNGVPQYEVPGPHNPVKPGMILKAYTNPPRSQATLNVKEGDLVQIVKPVSGTTHLGQNIETDERGQVPEYIFDRPVDYATPREEGDSPTPATEEISPPVETRNMMDVDLQSAILSEVSEDTSMANNESSDPNTIKSADQALDIQVKSDGVAEGEKVKKVKKEIRFEPTTEWYKRLKDEGKGWEHIFVDGWQGAFRYLSLHKEK